MSAPVDVLAVMERLSYALQDRAAIVVEVNAARAAVAELIKAGRDLQAAMDENETSKFDAGPAKRFLAADAAHRAALARCGGAA